MSFQRLFTWNLSQLLALSSVYRTASGTRLGKTSAIGRQQPDALVSPCRLCELVGRRDLSLSLSSFPAPQPLSPSWHVPGWADSLIHGTITSYFPQCGKWVHQQSGHHSKSNKIWKGVCLCVAVHMRQATYSCGRIVKRWGDLRLS